MVEFSYLTQMAYLEVWHPRYHDKTVLLACRKIGTHNKVRFTDAPSMGAGYYYISGEDAKKFPRESNGSIDCYAVKLDSLEVLEISKKDWRALV